MGICCSHTCRSNRPCAGPTHSSSRRLTASRGQSTAPGVPTAPSSILCRPHGHRRHGTARTLRVCTQWYTAVYSQWYTAGLQSTLRVCTQWYTAGLHTMVHCRSTDTAGLQTLQVYTQWYTAGLHTMVHCRSTDTAGLQTLQVYTQWYTAGLQTLQVYTIVHCRSTHNDTLQVYRHCKSTDNGTLQVYRHCRSTHNGTLQVYRLGSIGLQSTAGCRLRITCLQRKVVIHRPKV